MDETKVEDNPAAGQTTPGKPKICITGATGLVGSNAVEHFVKAGYPVTAVVRSANTAEHLIEFNNAQPAGSQLKLVTATLNDPVALKEAMNEADVVIHAAGSVNPYGSREEIFATNVGGTKNALAAAKMAHVKHFIFISSLSVITGQGDQYDTDESAPLRPCGESYADSKIEAEKLVMAEAASIDVTSLRPGFIYGPRERAWMPRLINNIKNGSAMLIDGGGRETNVIYVENLCRAIEGAVLNPRAYRQAYNLTDGQKTTKKQLFDAIADGLGLPRVTKSVPRPVAKLACDIVSSIAPLLSAQTQQKLSRFSRGAFRLAAVNQGFSIAKAERDLRYTDRIPFSEGMARTLEFFKTAQAEEKTTQSPTDLSAARRR